MDFIQIRIIYRFGFPQIIIVDNVQHFKSPTLYKLYPKYQITENHSSRYHAPEIGLAKAFNKILYMIPKKMVGETKNTWPESFLRPYGLTELQSGLRSRELHTLWSLEEKLSSCWKIVPVIYGGHPQGNDKRKRANTCIIVLETFDDDRLPAQ